MALLARCDLSVSFLGAARGPPGIYTIPVLPSFEDACESCRAGSARHGIVRAEFGSI